MICVALRFKARLRRTALMTMAAIATGKSQIPIVKIAMKTIIGQYTRMLQASRIMHYSGLSRN